jgi:hypothetical protein
MGKSRFYLTSMGKRKGRVGRTAGPAARKGSVPLATMFNGRAAA